MQTIAEALQALEPVKKKRGGNSEVCAIVGEIEKIIPITKEYDYGFWLRKVGERMITYSEMVGIIKELGSMNLKYNKGATLVNMLKKYPKKKREIKLKKPKKKKSKTLNLFND